MQIHGYTESGMIRVTVNGVEHHVPDTEVDRQRWGIAAWQAEGNTIPAYAPPAPTADDVKAEAMRRILALCPEWRQRNLTARAAELADKGRDNWTAEELAEWSAGAAVWAQIKALRAASDVIEAMDPIPADYTADSRWEAR